MSRQQIPSFDGVIFDLDGTLANTLGDIAGAMNRALADHDLPPYTLDDYKRMLGKGVRPLAEYALPPSMHARIDEGVEVFRRYYREDWVGASKPYAGILDLLEALDVPHAVLSNKPQAPVEAVVTAHFKDVPWVAVLGSRPDVPKKPDPTVALSIAKSMDVAPERCVFVGDTRVDIDAALNAGMIPVGVSWGFQPPDELSDGGAVCILHEPMDLVSGLRVG
jgi:phosphoglycolate phosphatase